MSRRRPRLPCLSPEMHAAGLGGVWGAARVHGEERNTRGPSAPPGSRQRGSYKPTAKSSAAQRASEGTVVVSRLATNNARGAKGPCGGHVGGASTREGMTGTPVPTHPGGRPPIDKVRQLQRRLWVAAKRSPERRFHALLDRIYRRDVLWEAWRRVKREPRRGGRRSRDARRRRAVRGGAHARRAARRAARRHVSAAAGPAAIHPEGRWPAAAARHSDGPRSGRADGGHDRAGADLRGGFPRLVVWVSAEAQRHAGAGNAARARRAWREPRAGRGYPRLLREHRSREAPEAGGASASRIGGC